MLKPDRGQAGAWAIAQFARAWFTEFQQIASNSNVAQETEAPPTVHVENLWEEMRCKPQKEMQLDFPRVQTR